MSTQVFGMVPFRMVLINQYSKNCTLNNNSIGKNVSIGSKTVLKNAILLDEGIVDSIIIADNVLVGENCFLSSCAIDSNVKVGSNSSILDGATIERDSILDDNSYLGTAKVIPSGQLWSGSPATFVRDLTHEEIDGLRKAPTQKYLYILNKNRYDESRSHKALFE